MTDEMACVLCGGSWETIAHALRDSDFAAAVSVKLFYADQVRDFYALNFNDWLTANLDGKFHFQRFWE